MSAATRRVRLQFATAALLVFVAAGGRAETIVYEHEEQPLFSIEVADGWLVDLDFAEEAREAGTPEGEEPVFRIVEISPDDGSHVWLGLWALPDVETLDEGAAYVTSLRQDLFTDVNMSEPADEDFNGMRGRSIKGTAARDGKPVELVFALFEARSGAVVAALYVGEIGDWQAHVDELGAMVRSLEPVAP